MESDSEDNNRKPTERKGRGSKRKMGGDKNSDDYKRRRERNNVAVKKSRTKSKQKARATMERVNSLQEENASLENKIKLLSKELSFLKDLFLSHAAGSGDKNLSCLDVETILALNLDKQDVMGNGSAVKMEDDEQDISSGSNDHEYTLQLNVKVKV